MVQTANDHEYTILQLEYAARCLNRLNRWLFARAYTTRRASSVSGMASAVVTNAEYSTVTDDLAGSQR